MKLLTSILILVCVDLISGRPQDRSDYWDSPIQFCGSTLPWHMAMICKGLYNEKAPTPTRQAQLTKRGIVDDCCKIPCTRRFVKTHYCATPPKQTTPNIMVTTEPTTMKPTTTETTTTETTTTKPTTTKPTTTKPTTTKPTTTEQPSRVNPVDYNMYYFALRSIGRHFAG